MGNRVLVTGGAGFIGSALCVRLKDQGYNVRVLDNLSEQIHGPEPERSYTYNLIKDRVEFIHGDVKNRKDWEKSLKEVDCVVHLAAETGTGQSMYEIEKYVNTNITGTAIFLDLLVNEPNEINKVLIASSRAVYGEGRYHCHEHGFVFPDSRKEEDLLRGDFECKCPLCKKKVDVRSTDEGSAIKPSSIYAITKFTQEQLVISTCKALGIASFAFRYQNVYGPGQSLRNPYTGILSIFTNLLRKNDEINIFEDGMESRDFVYIDDVVDATCFGVMNNLNGGIYNVGSGCRTTVADVVNGLSKSLNISSKIKISGNFRKGDIRHSLADLMKIKKDLKFISKINFMEGIRRYTDWASTEKITDYGYQGSLDQMRQRGLFK